MKRTFQPSVRKRKISTGLDPKWKQLVAEVFLPEEEPRGEKVNCF